MLNGLVSAPAPPAFKLANFFDDLHRLIQDFPDVERQHQSLRRKPNFWQDFHQNCMKMKEIEPKGDKHP